MEFIGVINTMKAFEFCAKTTPEGSLEFPKDVENIFPSNHTVRVIVLMNEPEEKIDQLSWSRLTAEEFYKGYSQEDSIYDH